VTGRVARRTASLTSGKATSGPIERPARNRKLAVIAALVGSGAAAVAYCVYYGVGRLPFQHQAAAPEDALETARSSAAAVADPLRSSPPKTEVTPMSANARVVPDSDDPPLASEHSIREQGATLRAGFERPPTPGRLARLAAVLISPEHDLHRARVEMALRAPTGREQTLSVERDGDRYVADYLFRATGVYQVRVRAQSAGVAPLTLVFDVDVPRRPVAANRGSRERRSSGEDLPITVIPAEPVRPRLIGGGAPRAPAPPRPGPSETASPATEPDTP
jgi:hypothetical protein